MERSNEELQQRLEEVTKSLELLTRSQEAEYRRLSLDLHDELGQSLTSILLRIKMIQAENDWEKARASLDDLRELVNDVLAEVRRLSRNLRPIVLETMGLIPAVEWYVENFEKQTGIETYFKYNATRKRFPEKMETNVYRILQEAMNNAAKHSGASYVSVSISYQKDWFLMSIRDNGCGIDERKAGEGLGLIGMRERARMLGGYLTIRGNPKQGTQVLLELRVTKEREEGHDERQQDFSGR